MAITSQGMTTIRAQKAPDEEVGFKTSGTPIKKAWDQYLDGYPAFSAFLVNDPDKTGTIFRKFDRTSAWNLLYLENELSSLESRLDILEEDSKLNDSMRACARNWDTLVEAAHGGNDRAMVIRELVVEIREKVKEYHEALVLYNQVLSFTSPERRALKANRQVFSKDLSWKQPQETMISGSLSKHLSMENDQDLCALKALPKPDRLTRLFEGKLAFLFREKVAGHYEDYVRHQTVERVVSAISSILAAIFLIGAVLGLYFMKSQNARIGMLCGFTIAFAGSLALLTNARRQEVFATTAAYAAVLVVFLSGDFAHNSDSSSGSSATTPTIVTVNSTVFASTNT